MANLDSLYLPIKSDMDQVAKTIEGCLATHANAKIQDLQRYILETPGKRLRPALCLLVCQALKKDTIMKGNLIHVASALELIHMASLIHDDVIDEAAVRHDMPSVVSKWGQGVAITSGVLLYSMALGLLCDADDIPSLLVISEAVKTLCNGELKQILERGNTDLSVTNYLDILDNKTGVLFAAACRCGAILAQASPDQVKSAESYGRKLGVVFQILDDVMDLTGDEKTLKKEAGQDFKQGEATLPVLLLLDQSGAKEREEILALLQAKTNEAFTLFQERLSRSSVITQSKKIAFDLLDDAIDALNVFPHSDLKVALVELAEHIKSRV